MDHGLRAVVGMWHVACAMHQIPEFPSLPSCSLAWHTCKNARHFVEQALTKALMPILVVRKMWIGDPDCRGLGHRDVESQKSFVRALTGLVLDFLLFPS